MQVTHGTLIKTHVLTVQLSEDDVVKLTNEISNINRDTPYIETLTRQVIDEARSLSEA